MKFSLENLKNLKNFLESTNSILANSERKIQSNLTAKETDLRDQCGTVLCCDTLIGTTDKINYRKCFYGENRARWR